MNSPSCGASAEPSSPCGRKDVVSVIVRKPSPSEGWTVNDPSGFAVAAQEPELEAHTVSAATSSKSPGAVTSTVVGAESIWVSYW